MANFREFLEGDREEVVYSPLQNYFCHCQAWFHTPPQLVQEARSVHPASAALSPFLLQGNSSIDANLPYYKVLTLLMLSLCGKITALQAPLFQCNCFAPSHAALQPPLLQGNSSAAYPAAS